MSATILSLLLAGVLADDSQTPRKQSGIAPSLHELTDEEEEALDRLIDRFIAGEVGKLRAEDAKKARLDVEKLGMDAIPALIRGLNKAAKIEGSCPATILAKKLAKMLATTEDVELLEIARENIGLEVGRTSHSGLLADLRVGCSARKAELSRSGITEKTPVTPPRTEIKTEIKSLRSMSTAELSEIAGKERGPRLKQVLTEISSRKGTEVVSTLGAAAASYDSDTSKLARDLLERNLSRESQEFVKDRLKDDHATVRRAAVRVSADKGWNFAKELIGVLAEDTDADVREEAHQALVKLNRGKDLGPDAKATAAERAKAVQRWREWLGEK
jgi:hypothetical protein